MSLDDLAHDRRRDLRRRIRLPRRRRRRRTAASSAGKNDANNDVSPLPATCAVPVLPDDPGTARREAVNAGYAVPCGSSLCTTFLKPGQHRRAHGRVDGHDAARLRLRPRARLRRSASLHALTDVRRHKRAAVGERGVHGWRAAAASRARRPGRPPREMSSPGYQRAVRRASPARSCSSTFANVRLPLGSGMRPVASSSSMPVWLLEAERPRLPVGCRARVLVAVLPRVPELVAHRVEVRVARHGAAPAPGSPARCARTWRCRTTGSPIEHLPVVGVVLVDAGGSP